MDEKISKSEYDKKYSEENKEKIKQRKKEYYLKNKDKLLKKHIERYYDNKEEIAEKAKERYYKDINKSRERGTTYYKNNKEEILLKQKEKWKINGKDKIKERRKNDPIFKLKGTMSNRLRNFLKSKGLNKKNKRTFDIIGCSPELLREYIENKFKIGMTWNNHGEWHIDHILPLDLASTEEQIYKLSHYTNLQPLWKSENLSKGCKIQK